MKDKKYKYLEDLFDEYIQLQEEQTEMPAVIEKAEKKFNQYLSDEPNVVYKQADAEDLYKAHTVLKKHEERKNLINEELAEVEESIKSFLRSLNGGKVSYERKDDDKTKVSYLFFLEGEHLKCTR